MTVRPVRLQLSRAKGFNLQELSREPGWVSKVAPPLEEIIADLRGNNLVCWCRPGDPCHADTLLELANA